MHSYASTYSREFLSYPEAAAPSMSSLTSTSLDSWTSTDMLTGSASTSSSASTFFSSSPIFISSSFTSVPSIPPLTLTKISFLRNVGRVYGGLYCSTKISPSSNAIPSSCRAANRASRCRTTSAGVANPGNSRAATLTASMRLIVTSEGWRGLGTLSRLYLEGITKDMLRVLPSLSTDVITGVVMLIASFLSFLPKRKDASSLNAFPSSCLPVLMSLEARSIDEYSLTSYSSEELTTE
mmetsp:Transcript_32656/g.103400  ORF Transcript_32656/g.103400 Transcript_32656/m.103400 type:complete len:238 (-) Transcript_32656:648-1361(-)